MNYNNQETFGDCSCKNCENTGLAIEEINNGNRGHKGCPKEVNVGCLFACGAEKAFKKATAKYTILCEDAITFTERVNKEREYYCDGKRITFTFIIKNDGDLKVENLIFKECLNDDIDPIGQNYEITTTTGHVCQKGREITITNIDLCENEICIISIGGIIKK